MNIYKSKYLKYKKKYFEFKKKIFGGANCPLIGYYQHKGECWHDSITMILIYGDEIGEHIQRIFDNSFDLDDCIDYAIKNTPSYLRPANISEKDTDLFIEYSKDYIKNIYDRYQNDKLSIKPQSISSKIPSPLAKKPALYRRDSINETMACNYNIFNITNLNNLDRKAFSSTNHGGSIHHINTTVSLINYFLINFNPKNSKHLKMDNNFINIVSFNFIENIFYRFQQVEFHNKDKDNLIKIRENITQILEMLIDFERFVFNCKSILLDLYPTFLLNDDDRPKKNFISHVVAFISCGGNKYFYDNNGVEPKIDKDGDKRNEMRREDMEINPEVYLSDKDIEKLERFDLVYREKNIKLIVEFDWKKHILSKIIDARLNLKDILVAKDIKLDDFKKILLDFSDCFYGHNPDKKQTIGHNSLKDFFISNMHFVLNSNFFNEEHYFRQTQQQLFLNYAYTNDEAIENLIKYFPIPDALNNQGIVILIDNAVRNENHKLFEYIDRNTKLDEMLFLRIKMDRLFNYIQNNDIQSVKFAIKIFKIKKEGLEIMLESIKIKFPEMHSEISKLV